jgi:hypothetical protein
MTNISFEGCYNGNLLELGCNMLSDMKEYINPSRTTFFGTGTSPVLFHSSISI